MKNLVTFLLIANLVSINSSKAQYVTIPDTNFVNWLNINFPSCMNGNQMDTTCSAILNTTSIWNLQNQNISNLSGIEYFKNLTLINCNSAWISEIPKLPNSLITFWGNNMRLTNFPSLPSNLQRLECRGNQLTQLPNLPNSLIELDCEGNQLTQLPLLPNSLEELKCGGNFIDTLPTLSSNLRYLSCGGNLLMNLPILSNLLTELYCGGNLLVSLPNLLNTNLAILHCSYNNLSTLPSLPNTLKEINCSSNPLFTLPTLPLNLETLFCLRDSLLTLPSLPATLKNLYCQENQLTNLPELPSTLKVLWCSYNQLTYIDSLPSTLTNFDCNDNDIYCFKYLPDCAMHLHNNPFTCLPNYTSRMGFLSYMFDLLNYPLCVNGDTIFNSSGCDGVNGVVGNVFTDNNSNCIFDTLDYGMANISIKVYDNNNYFISQTNSLSSGLYNFVLPIDSFIIKLDTVNKPYTTICNNIVRNVVLDSNNQLVKDVDFDLICKSGFDVGIQSIVETGWVFPGQQHNLCISAGDMSKWFGLDCASGISGTVQVNVYGNVVYNGAMIGAIIPTSSLNNSFIYNISDFSALNNSSIGLKFIVDSTAQAGDSICVEAFVTSINFDNNSLNDTLLYCYPIVNSYDPNKKQVYPQDVEVGFEDWFEYTVYFQNTGTAPAFNIRIKDSLDTKLDIETFEVVNYSHLNYFAINNRVVTFLFPNIMLKDSSTNFIESIGFVRYRIKPKKNLALGTIIKNTAYIYFDYNYPIVTNTTINEFILPISVEELNVDIRNLTIYPNPFSNQFLVSFKPSDKTTVEVYNLLGGRVLTQQITTLLTLLDLSNQPNGVYFVRVTDGKEVLTKKVIKQ